MSSWCIGAGLIPDSLGSLQELQLLCLDHNQLTGVKLVPTEREMDKSNHPSSSVQEAQYELEMHAA
jgi:hypothetical protein